MAIDPELMQFFFATMSGPNSYAGGGKPVPIEGMPGWKGFDVERGPYRLVDRYADGVNGRFFGHTMMWNGQELKFYMTYFGIYPEEVNPLLRRVLFDTYQSGSFCGGRGWKLDGNTPFRYTNEWGEVNEYFSGEERIFRRDNDEKMGGVTYEGMFLL
ncbi:hypothetical protein A3F55_00130 [Candidatus Adlerbacteria bacterium RIFCSPHIGHO2_12_FULL_53_18]|uniref:DUF5680 domain-containing protein n=1 Tax=Candidatus Adlerbacteria bacterium RIFCSPHIGHO2_12_FULL_53_18 TaxID=1797242 RepID=A0A1F4XT39_9BACT|nr:MAG: hypothetical protein A3F55_00130 [Candidatus Adlerbacteria bacterium RIFCSPHIGHO2_12_FULL_53_18]